MRFTVIASLKASHQVSNQAILAEGLRAHGIDVVMSDGSAKTKFVACWGWRKGRQLRAAGHEVLVMERGYLGDRFSNTSLAWNGLNGRGNFGVIPDDGGERFDKKFSLSPWKTGGDYALIMGQVPGDASLQGRDLMPWYQRCALEARARYGLDVHFRPHPVAIQKGFRQALRGVQQSTGDLAECLNNAAVVITFNSNSGVDAALSGVPVVAVDTGSMAFSVAAHRVGEKIIPDREQWAARLAWCQWSAEEIATGVALDGLFATRTVQQEKCA